MAALHAHAVDRRHGQTLQERTIVALADLVESPAGALLLQRRVAGIRAVGALEHAARSTRVERSDGPLAAFLERTGWIVSIPECRADPARYGGLALPEWLAIAAIRRG